jgi:hypothetical protein
VRERTKTKIHINRSLNALIAVSAVIGILFPAVMMSQDSTVDVSGALIQVAKELYPEYGPVRFHREEHLEDSIDSGQKGRESMPRIYQIEQPRFDRSGPTTTVRVPSGLPTMYVATSIDGSVVYRLTGFQGAERSFNQLVKDFQLPNIHGKQAAESRGLFCAEVVYGLSPKWWLNGPSGAKLLAAEHFFAQGHEDGLTLAEHWWKSAKGNRTSLNISTIQSNSDFVLRVPVFWSPVEGDVKPEVKLYSITVTDSGTCLMHAGPIVVLK